MKNIFQGAVIISAIFLLSGCGRMTDPVSKTDFIMDTVATVTICDGWSREDAEEILNECFNEIRRYERLFSAEIDDSDVSRINRSKGEKVTVSRETAELLDIALHYCALSNGVFDISVRPVSKLWDFKSEDPAVPKETEIRKALSHVGYENIILDKEERSVYLKDPEAQIDLGAVAKGYTGDRIKEFLESKGVRSAIINLGGNVVLLGSRPDGSPFKVGIEKPFGEAGEMIKTLSEEDVSIVTSGNYERCFIKDGKLYHHIIDTKTGYPAESGLDSVTIVSPLSVDGDALSTLCFCLGKDGAEELIDSLGDKGISVYFSQSG